jgi:hypothetical protein
MAPKSNAEFAAIGARLRAILKKYAKGSLVWSEDARTGNAQLTGPAVERSLGREVWFGGVRTGKAYVSYHLMAIYACPDLLESLSPELRKRMQGKSCFNFRHVDEALFKELAQLTDRSYKRFKQEGFIR